MSSLSTSFDLSVRSLHVVVISFLLSLAAGPRSFAGFELDSWTLTNSVIDFSGPSSTIDSDRIQETANPLQAISTAQLGNNITTSTYDFSWLEDMGVGDFNTTISHTMRNSFGLSTATLNRIFIATDVDLVVSFDGSINYSHTPGDETQFLFGMSVRDVLTTEVFFTQSFEGGNADLLPASGTLAVAGETIIPAGGLYRLQVALSADNFDEDSAGIYDANGFANISIRPVPEPQALLLVLFGACATILRRPR